VPLLLIPSGMIVLSDGFVDALFDDDDVDDEPAAEAAVPLDPVVEVPVLEELLVSEATLVGVVGLFVVPIPLEVEPVLRD
jgi:hypothetical protein